MKNFGTICSKAARCLLIFTIICGLLYTGLVTGLAQLLFPRQANGGILEVDGARYGCALLGQQYTGDGYLWGRVMNLDVSTYRGPDGEALLYAVPSNLSPAGAEYESLVAGRAARLRASNPGMAGEPIPADLVTCSGSGLDPDISPAAAEYQVKRIAAARGIPEREVLDIIGRCTTGRFLGVFGEPAVNVLKVNLTLDGVLR